jgi:hypothetical protein
VTPELQFALTFVTLVVLAVVLYVRMIRYDQYLREEKEGIQRLNERLQALTDGLEALGLRTVEERLLEIQEVLESIRDGLQRPLPAASGPTAVEPSEASLRRSSLIDIVEAKLYNLGYGKVSVVTDLTGVDSQEPTRIVVEAERNGVAHKGYLVIHGSAVTELEMQPSYTSFP